MYSVKIGIQAGEGDVPNRGFKTNYTSAIYHSLWNGTPRPTEQEEGYLGDFLHSRRNDQPGVDQNQLPTETRYDKNGSPWVSLQTLPRKKVSWTRWSGHVSIMFTTVWKISRHELPSKIMLFDWTSQGIEQQMHIVRFFLIIIKRLRNQFISTSNKFAPLNDDEERSTRKEKRTLIEVKCTTGNENANPKKMTLLT